jgi:hypothetical protein
MVHPLVQPLVCHPQSKFISSANIMIASVSMTTSVVYTTQTFTITACPSTVTNCPAKSTSVVTSTIALYTVSIPLSCIIHSILTLADGLPRYTCDHYLYAKLNCSRYDHFRRLHYADLYHNLMRSYSNKLPCGIHESSH